MIVGVRTVLDAILRVGSVIVNLVGEEYTVTHLAIKIGKLKTLIQNNSKILLYWLYGTSIEINVDLVKLTIQYFFLYFGQCFLLMLSNLYAIV